MIDTLPLLCIGFIVLVFVMPMWYWINTSDRRSAAEHEKAVAAGRHEPVTIQPFIDTSLCMGSGSCVKACPENVLKVVAGQAVAVNMAECIGHGACVAACPVGAIELVFGSEKRGIEIPKVGSDFQTNVPGLFIAGELGGMGLIANAAEQGVRALNNAAVGLKSRRDMVDVIIIGAGPAGIAAAAAATTRKPPLSYAVFEQEALGGAIRHYPRKKLVFTRPLEVPGIGKLNFKTLHKEQLEKVFFDIVERLGLEIHAGERVDRVNRTADGFEVVTAKRTARAQRVILALGRRGTPRKLDVPGEDLPKVAYALLEPEQYRDHHILVVGGGDSAVEAAIQLGEEPGNVVTLSYRGTAINRPKEQNIERLRKAERAGRVKVILESVVTGISADRVELDQRGQPLAPIANDFVFVMVGGVLPTKFLQAAGVAVEKHFGKGYPEKVEAKPTRAAPPKASVARSAAREELTVQLPEVPDDLAADPHEYQTVLLPNVATPLVDRRGPERSAFERLLDQGQWAEAVGPIGAAAEQARARGDQREAARGLLLLGRVLCDLGRPQESQAAWSDAVRLAGPDQRAECLLLEAQLGLFRGDLLVAEQRFADAAEATRDPRLRARGLAGLAECTAAEGNGVAALERLDEAIAVAAGEPSVELASLWVRRAEYSAVLGRYGGALLALDQAMTLGPFAEAPVVRARSLGATAEWNTTFGMQSEAVEAVRHLQPLVAAGRSGNVPAALAGARALCVLARTEDASELLRSLSTHDGPFDNPAAQLVALRARLLARGDPNTASKLAREALARRVPTDPVASARIALDAAHALADSGASAEAKEAVKRGLKAVKGAGHKGLRLNLLTLMCRVAPDPRVAEATANAAKFVLDDLTRAPGELAARAARQLRRRAEIVAVLGPTT